VPSQNFVRFFLERDEYVGDVQFSLELRVAFRELNVKPLGLGEFRLPASLLGRQARGPVSAQQRAPI
jgi:hypothetical protein